MKMNTYKIFLLILSFFMSVQSFAQFSTETPELSEPDDRCKISLSGSLASRYLWRGMNLGGSSPHLQTEVSVDFGSSGLNLTTFASAGINNSFGELDWILTYTPVSYFSILYSDYYVFNDLAYFDYFEYNPDSTFHTHEVSLLFNGTETLPIDVLLAINVFGFDYKNADNEIVYSKYLEVGYTFRNSAVKPRFFVGAALDTPEDNTVGYYLQSKAGIVNLGVSCSKNIQLNDKLSFPFATTLMLNPDLKEAFLAFTLSF